MPVNLACFLCRNDHIRAALQAGCMSPGAGQASTKAIDVDKLQTRTYQVHPRLSRIPVDSSGRYVKVSEPDNTFPFIAFSVDDFDDEEAEPLVMRNPSDEFAVFLHVRFLSSIVPVCLGPGALSISTLYPLTSDVLSVVKILQ